MDNFWEIFWTGLTVALIVGEVATAGFFMLPFAIGAGVAASLAWFGVNVAIQWFAFAITGVVSFIWLQRFAKTDAVQPHGANRFDGATAVVIDAIDHTEHTGAVRFGSEEWRAVSDDVDIEVGTRVNILEVRGTRLVVSPIQESKEEGATT